MLRTILLITVIYFYGPNLLADEDFIGFEDDLLRMRNYWHSRSPDMIPNHGCSMLNVLKSIEGKNKISVRFVNSHGNLIHIYWINYQGKEVFYKTLQKGKSYLQRTYLTHPWVIRDNNKRCLGSYEPVAIDSKAVVF